jgi:hypothetical protein
MKRIFAALSLVLFSFIAAAQNEELPPSAYNPHDLFSPLFYTSSETNTRAATGEPNVAYWQNRADYQINASLNEITHEVTGLWRSVTRITAPTSCLSFGCNSTKIFLTGEPGPGQDAGRRPQPVWGCKKQF